MKHFTGGFGENEINETQEMHLLLKLKDLHWNWKEHLAEIKTLTIWQYDQNIVWILSHKVSMQCNPF